MARYTELRRNAMLAVRTLRFAHPTLPPVGCAKARIPRRAHAFPVRGHPSRRAHANQLIDGAPITQIVWRPLVLILAAITLDDQVRPASSFRLPRRGPA